MTLSRYAAIVRRTPSGQLGRRLYLVAKRRLLDRLPSPAHKAYDGLLPSANRTFGLHAPHGRVGRDETGWHGHFLNETRTFGADLPWATLSGDGADQLWRMNLHYFEYLPDVATEDLEPLIDSWIAACRPRSPVSSSAAWTPYAISLRISAWLEAWSVRGPFGSADFGRRFATSLIEQAGYLSHNLETDIRGNHLIKNIRALTEIAAAFGVPARRFARIADQLLVRELRHQMLPDGVHYERSVAYHNQVFADFLTIAANRSTTDAAGQRLAAALEGMAQATADLTHPDGAPEQFGDAGLQMTATGAACLAAFGELTSSVPAPRSAISFTDAGFYGHRTGADFFIARMGPLGPGDLMGHAHGDWGSFEWSVDAQRVIVNQGVHEYRAGPKRVLSRSTASHNTATLDGAEQADFFGAFRCGVAPTPAKPEYSASGAGLTLEGELVPACHQGAGRQRRTITLKGRRLQILDRAVHGKTLVSHLLLHPSVAVSEMDDGVELRLPSGVTGKVVTTRGALSIEPAIWWPNMGVEMATTHIVMSDDCEVDFIIDFSARSS
jgi:uncharacterized heparinase superfamily protein